MARIGDDAFAGIDQHRVDTAGLQSSSDDATGKQLAHSEDVVRAAKSEFTQSGNSTQDILRRIEQSLRLPYGRRARAAR